MIKYEWRTDLSVDESAELAEMLDRAAHHDAEAEHTTIDFATVERAMATQSKSIRHLVVWMLPHAVAMDDPDERERIVGLIRLEFDTPGAATGEAQVSAVVDPRFRSIGIITLLLEQVGVEPDVEEGWLGSAAQIVSAWARGNHPAAGRISKRFLVSPSRRVWKLFRPLGPDDKRAATSGDGTFVLSAKPAASQEFGPYLTIEEFVPAPHADDRARRGLLDAAAAVAAKSGHAAIAIHVDSADRALVQTCRLSGFQHDRTDVCYQIGGRR